MDDWRSYDSVAETYARIHAPRLAEPARDLVELTGIGSGWRVLDVGTGTGVAAFAAAGTGANVVGIDEAPGMLRVARSANGSLPVATAIAIDLPFRNGAFDALLANFVLAHFTKYKTALFDMKRAYGVGHPPRPDRGAPLPLPVLARRVRGGPVDVGDRPVRPLDAGRRPVRGVPAAG
jgi:ubiquinone/menaquinone biosynthesis C-methylase UbiE